MEWLQKLLFEDGVAHTILIYAFVIFTGVQLGKIKILGVSLGATFVLFMGLFAGHFGFSVEGHLIHFIKEFGLILFVFSIGLQVGPGFFSSFKKGGMTLNLLAAGIVLLGASLTVAFFYLFQDRLTMPDMVGVMSGAVTNTPGLGAAQEALHQAFDAGKITELPSIALGYAVAYPLGVVGIILSMIFIRVIFKIDLNKEAEMAVAEGNSGQEKPERFTLELTNDAINGKRLHTIKKMVGRSFVISRMLRDGEFSIPQTETRLKVGDKLLIISSATDKEAIKAFIGAEMETSAVNWVVKDTHSVSRRIVITQNNINGKTIEQLKLRTLYGVNITRVNRSGVNLLGSKDLVLQVGDRVMIVGEIENIKKVEALLGNTLKRLDHPHIVTIFFGIFVGILFGSIPFFVPGIPMPVKLGLAGGPLIVAILLGRFGYKLKLVTFTTQSANLMLREIGITLFLASVGLASGSKFVETVISSNGLLWIGLGFVITTVPLITIGIIGRKFGKLNYYTIIGLLAGSTTDPPALSYASSVGDNDRPAIAYSTVYPLTMFLRVITAQILILAFL